MKMNKIEKNGTMSKVELCDDVLEQVIGGAFHPNTEKWLKRLKTYMADDFFGGDPGEGYDAIYYLDDLIVEALINDLRIAEEVIPLDDVKERLRSKGDYFANIVDII